MHLRQRLEPGWIVHDRTVPGWQVQERRHLQQDGRTVRISWLLRPYCVAIEWEDSEESVMSVQCGGGVATKVHVLVFCFQLLVCNRLARYHVHN